MGQSDSTKDPLLHFLQVPLVCKYNASKKTTRFQDIPSYYDLNLELACHPLSTNLCPDGAAAFLQEWLFFAVLNGICEVVDVEFDPMDFVVSSAAGQAERLITGRHFRKYVWFWVGGLELGTCTIEGRHQEQREGATFILQTLERALDAWIQLCDHDHLYNSSTVLNMVLLSIVQLGAHLRTVLGSILHEPGLTSNESFLKGYPIQGREVLFKPLLLKAGWCVGEVPTLLSRYRPYTLLYLSTINRRRGHKDHSRCSTKGCIVNQLDGDTYNTAHAPACPGLDSCNMVHAPIEEVCRILEAGDIPLLSISAEPPSSPAPLLEVKPFVLGGDSDTTPARYVAISHVWSHGMGNPRANASYACQIRRIQRAANDLYRSDNGPVPGNVLFWMDTLCVPLDPKLRTLAIVRMSRTYMHADKVLVIDNWLAESSFSSDEPNSLLFKIVHSDWSTRLWTFQEAVLARELTFQFADGAFTTYQIEDAGAGPSSLEELSEVLEGIPEDKLLSTKCTLNLLCALGQVDPASVDRSAAVRRTAALPPQSDPIRELDRLTAINTETVHTSLCNVTERWFPVLARADCFPGNPRDHLVRLNSLVRPLHSDPVGLHASGAAELIRGMGYDTIVNRSKDLSGGGTGTGRKLQGIENTPSGLLSSIVNGARHRTTSWKEDETICLGGITGLDLTPIAQIRVDWDRREEQVQPVSEERMKMFLSAIGNLPESLLFLPSHRMAAYPWRWAPPSFLGTDYALPFADHYRAQCTNQGLLVNCDTIQIACTSDQKQLVLEGTKTMDLRQRIPRGYTLRGPVAPNTGPWKDVLFRCHIIGQDESWSKFFSQYEGELYLLKRSYPLRRAKDADAVLVRFLAVKEDTRFAHFLAKVQLTHLTTLGPGPGLQSCVDGELEPTKVKWCVG
ncbi:hypothetical protein A1O3_03872 [Capronia epimyces CBS 606.96]|uniref:Heterokaryon incompatibility domain-containing protein n=1 Tax=Capronia epimyces CBS 606.96 TaxID=1182542 RepID=W9Y360_9EURO|nr:uncharacterized protein A1O3_03872 [Capronia epimyces CBS 606.96]EXJ86918.1 hypothetical protein A1O3_03872 [Capronia epimyces CBS 606.96]